MRQYAVLVMNVLGTWAEHVMRSVPLVDNFRDSQEIGSHRFIYRSANASATCDSPVVCGAGSQSNTCRNSLPTTPTQQVWGWTTPHHYTYYDQKGWHRYHHKWPNECGMTATGYAYPGESPIDVPPTLTQLAPSHVKINLSEGFKRRRRSLSAENNGHSFQIDLCKDSMDDCQATASFGGWPQTLRGASASDITPDEYYLLGFHFHWGDDSSKGSEHLICGHRRAAELHMVFANKRYLKTDRDDPDSGTFLAALSTLLEGGAAEDNPAYVPLLNHASELAHYQGDTGIFRDDITLVDLLPQDYATKYYTYPGSLTSPPCSQFMTWFVFENHVKVSERQLNQLRSLQTNADVRGHSNPQVMAMLLPIIALAMGSVTFQFLTNFAPWLPYTSTVLLEGFGVDYLAYLDRPSPELDPQFLLCPKPLECNSMQRSLDMWADIDGHLLLFIFLPVLLFGDAIGLDVHIFERVFVQSLLLAMPGVLFGAIMGGLFAYYVLPYGWSWNLAMAFGSIVSATDPVAVVALLKSVGASPRLTMQITGESLMNDGTAMVLFTLFFNMHMDWRQYDVGGIFSFLTSMCVAAPLLGLAIGFVGYIWMRTASRRHSDADSTVQMSVSIIIALLAFYLAEWECDISGVLCTVAAGLVFAAKVWPVVGSKDALESVWHALEYIGNTLVFFVAGIITRRSIWLSAIKHRDFYYLLLLFFVMLLIRLVMVALLYPLLLRIGYGTNEKDAGFMVWGGLRGAVGLALAVFVRSSLRGINGDAGAQVLFHTAGLALLTLLINASSSGFLLRMTGMVGISASKKQALEQVEQRIRAHAKETYASLCVAMNHDAVEAVEWLKDLETLRDSAQARPSRPSLDSNHRLTFMGVVEETNLSDRVKELEAKLAECDQVADAEQVQILRESFLRIVRGKYWELVRHGRLPQTSPAMIELLDAVATCMDALDQPLHDWSVLEPKMKNSKSGLSWFIERLLLSMDDCLPKCVTIDNELHYYMMVKRQENVYHTCASFIEAHMFAQEKLAFYFGTQAEADTPEEITVILESARQVLEAKNPIDGISSEVIELIKSTTVTSMIFEKLENFVHSLIEEGMLTESEAEEIAQRLHTEEHLFFNSMKRRASILHESVGEDANLSADQAAAANQQPQGEQNVQETASARQPAIRATMVELPHMFSNLSLLPHEGGPTMSH